MKSVSRTFTYKEYTFEIVVHLNTRAERRLNGKRWHTVNVLCSYPFFEHDQAEVEDFELEAYVIKQEALAKTWVDSKEKIVENPLAHLGYK